MRRVQLGGDAEGSETLGGTEEKPEPFVLRDDDFDRFERAGKIKLTAAARSALRGTCEAFLMFSRLGTRRPKQTEVRSLLTRLEAGLKKTSSALDDLAAPSEVSEAASLWLKHNWLEGTPPDLSSFVVSVELGHASVQKALGELGAIVAGAAKGPEPNLYWSRFFSELEQVYKDAGGRKAFQLFANEVVDTLPAWVRYKHSPDMRAKKQRLARAKREIKRLSG